MSHVNLSKVTSIYIINPKQEVCIVVFLLGWWSGPRQCWQHYSVSIKRRSNYSWTVFLLPQMTFTGFEFRTCRLQPPIVGMLLATKLRTGNTTIISLHKNCSSGRVVCYILQQTFLLYLFLWFSHLACCLHYDLL